MALATTPATTAIVSSAPAKQGVASAVNDVAREVGGALGIAVLGSALTDSYQSGVADAAAKPPGLRGGAPRPPCRGPCDLPALARGGANLPGRRRAAFVDGLGAATLIARGRAAVAAIFVFWRAPREAAVTERGRTPRSKARIEAEQPREGAERPPSPPRTTPATPPLLMQRKGHG